jgi:ribosomal protein S18 acetylase RimI-like enzyme
MAYEINRLQPRDRAWVTRFVGEKWGSALVVTRGQIHSADMLPGYVAWQEETRVGLATYCIAGDKCELISLNTVRENLGIGSALIEAVKQEAVSAGCQRLWLITTNDNMRALRFYQKRGFRLVAVYPNALEQSRRLKPEIPLVGLDGIPLRDEIELELPLE